MNNNAYNKNCLEAMVNMKENTFDLAIIDPPYGMGGDNPTVKPCRVKQKNGTTINVKQPNYKKSNWDNEVPPIEYFTELKRVSKHQIIWGVNYYPYSELTGGRLVWVKLNGESDQYGCEIAYVSINNRTDVVYYMWAGMMQGMEASTDPVKALIQQGNKAKNEKRIHPTQKPVKLYKWLLSRYAKQGDKIIDTHLGSGSSRLAAYDMGFDFTGFELNKEYFEAQESRFNYHIQQHSLFKPQDMYANNYRE